MKRVFTLVILAGLVLMGAGMARLRAADDEGAKTPEEAAKIFMVHLSVMFGQERAEYAPDTTLVSQNDIKVLGSHGVSLIVNELGKILFLDQWKAKKTAGSDENTAVIQVIPAETDYSRPVSCVREDGMWHVNLIETYRNWNDLSEQEAAQKIFDMTNVILPGVVVSDEAKRRVCQLHLKQVGLGMMQYIQDYDDCYPPSRQCNSGLRPYVKDTQVFQCPSVPSDGNGYAMNWKLSRHNASEVQSTSLMVITYDSRDPKPNAAGEGHDVDFRHLGGANFGYVDGHVKWNKPESPQQFTFKMRAR